MSVACSSGDDLSVDSAPFVFDAWIDSDGYPVVILTRALSPGDSPIDVSDMMVRWAKVTISDGERTVVMTGGVDHSVFPPFSYRSFDMKGEVGRTYTITADLYGVRAVTRSCILPSPKIESMEFFETSTGKYAGTLSFTAPDDADTCRFVLFTKVVGLDTRHYPSLMGTLTTTDPAQRATMPVYRGRHADLDAFGAGFVQGETVEVVLARVEPAVYKFWDMYQQHVYFGNNIFISATNTLSGNVDGGYGIFSARGVARCVAVVGE